MYYHEPMLSVAFSPDGKYLATATMMGRTARIWEVTTGQELARMNHDEHVSSVAFSPDGKYLVTASGDGTARIWEVTTGQEFARMQHEKPLYSVAFGPDGRYLAAAGADGTVGVHFLRSEDMIAEAAFWLIRNLTYQEWQRYLPDEPYRKTCPSRLIHHSFIEAGRDLAKAGDIKGAINIFRRVKELEPTLDLDPEEEAQRLASQSND
jgi:WD40 repeat protein